MCFCYIHKSHHGTQKKASGPLNRPLQIELMWMSEQNSGPLEEQWASLIDEPSLQQKLHSLRLKFYITDWLIDLFELVPCQIMWNPSLLENSLKRHKRLLSSRSSCSTRQGNRVWVLRTQEPSEYGNFYVIYTPESEHKTSSEETG
jgi:hypothetical protein